MRKIDELMDLVDALHGIEPYSHIEDQDNEICCYRIGNSNKQLEVHTHDGDPCVYFGEKRSASYALLDWNSDAWGSDADMLAAFGCKPVDMGVLHRAEPGDVRCQIWVEPHYYPGTYGAPLAHFWYTGDDPDDIWIGTYAEAKGVIHNYHNAPSQFDGIPACKVLAQGQYGSDTLTIVRG